MSTDLIPPRFRLLAYRIFALVGVGIGAVQVGYSSADVGQPVWLTVALAVYAFLGGALGMTAATYVPDNQEG